MFFTAYSTAQEAAIAFLKENNPRSTRINREIGGLVYKLRGKFFHTRPQTLDPAGGTIINLSKKQSISRYSSHSCKTQHRFCV